MAADSPYDPGVRKPPPTVIRTNPTNGRTGATVPSTVEDILKTPSAEDMQKAAEARADAKQKARDLKTGRRYMAASGDLQAQIESLRNAIRKQFGKSRRQNLADIDLMLSQQLGQIKEGAEKRGAKYADWAFDTELETGDAQERAGRNLVRERADTMTAILEQGAGETDAVRAMLANARNFHANTSEASRSYFDTLQSVNQGIVDLNVDTKSALSNAHMQAEGQREQVWQDFYNRRSEAQTLLGNVFSDRVGLIDQAKELGVKPNKRQAKQMANAKTGMKNQFGAASEELGKSYVEKPLPDWIDNYEGMAQVERRQSNTQLASAPVYEQVQRAQGATLRKWAA